MIRHLLALGLATTLASAALAAPQSFGIRSVVVEHDGRWHADPNGRQMPAQCRRFKLTDAAALRWFTRAREVTQQDWLERLDWTQCSANGTLMTDSGRQYRWELDQGGRGRVIVSPAVAVYLAGREVPFFQR